MKRNFYLLFVLLLFIAANLTAQIPFKIYTFQSGWGPKASAYLETSPVFGKMNVLTQGTIAMDNDTVLSISRLNRNLAIRFPDRNSSGMVLLDWEGKIMTYLRDQPVNRSKFKYAESQYLTLIAEVRRLRPNLLISLYGMPFRFFNDWQKAHYNTEGKLNNLLAKTDFISPSIYPLYPDEQKNIGHTRNLQYYRENTKEALVYGYKLNKPVIPLVWHRVQVSNKSFSNQIISPEVMARYIKHIAAVNVNGHQVSGVAWWENLGIGVSVKHATGVGNWTNKVVKDVKTYDSLQVEYLRTVAASISDLNNMPAGSSKSIRTKY